jgi:SREBP regulating gene protein
MRVVLHEAGQQSSRCGEEGLPRAGQVLYLQFVHVHIFADLVVKPSYATVSTLCQQAQQHHLCCREETGRWPNVFEYCRGKCRTSARSTVHENAYLAPDIHCFSELGMHSLMAWLLKFPSCNAVNIAMQVSWR